MRFLLKAEWDVETGNDTLRSGKIKEQLKELLDDIKPEAIYFTAMNGKRTSLAILNLENASQMAILGEPFFLKFKANIELLPLMTPEDLMLAEPELEKMVKKYG